MLMNILAVIAGAVIVTYLLAALLIAGWIILLSYTHYRDRRQWKKDKAVIHQVVDWRWGGHMYYTGRTLGDVKRHYYTLTGAVSYYPYLTDTPVYQLAVF